MFTIKFPWNVLYFFFFKYSTMFFNIYSNVAHKLTYAGQSLSEFFFFCLTASASWGHSSEPWHRLRCTSSGWQRCWPCQLWPVPRLAPFWSQRTAAARCGRGCRVAVTVASFDHCTSTLVLSAGSSRENPRYYSVLALFTWFALGRRKYLQTDY